MSESESLVERVADALRAACRKEYGSDWNNDVAQAFARAAIQAMREPTLAMVHAAPSRYMTVPIFPGSTQTQTIEKTLGPGPIDTFRAMIDAALA